MILNNIHAEDIQIGINTVIESTAIIRGITGPASKVSIGDNCYIGHGVQIICNEISIGDYCKIHNNTTIHGSLPCNIGHNAWIGQFTIIDSIGGAYFGNNCGIGAHSQFWSHIKYGDTLEGCRFLSEKPLTVGNDVWFVGHCIVQPVNVADKSMALAGSTIVKDMLENHVYAGSPAIDITDKIGNQFLTVSVEDKLGRLKKMHEQFGSPKEIVLVSDEKSIKWEDKKSYFNVSNRKYTKRRSTVEIEFMKFLLPEKAKFIPY
jgi:acetyltransferase-like isoleucine patch superfamily enzyme